MINKFGAKSTINEVLTGIDLKAKRFLITGISSGIGLETAYALVAHGANVIGTVRNLPKSAQAISSIQDAATQNGGHLEAIELDLASLQSVRTCANKLLHKGQLLDVIIANAGVMATPFSHTVDGFETQFGVNYLGHFALINSIEKLLVDGGRLIVLSSQAHRLADIDLEDPNFEQQAYDPWLAYGRSKTACALFAVEFDQRYRNRGVRAASIMPGNSFTGLTAHFSAAELENLFAAVSRARADAGLPPAELKKVEQAAATTAWAAIVANKDEIGGLYLEDCAIALRNDTPNPFADGVMSYALDTNKARQLWAKSEELLELVY